MHGLVSVDVLVNYLLRAIVVLIAIPFHEAAHALVSWQLGDPTAKNAGRLSLNPVRHFDLIGAVCMLVGGVGWAKPVGINARNFRNPKIGMAISAAAGPASNLLLAFLSMVVYKVLFYATQGMLPAVASRFFIYLIMMNISLAVFNLLPVPPFDGSRIGLLFLPQKFYFQAMRYERYIMYAVLILVLTGILNTPLGFLNNLAVDLLGKATLFVDLAFSR